MFTLRMLLAGMLATGALAVPAGHMSLGKRASEPIMWFDSDNKPTWHRNLCGDSTFDDKTTSKSPLVDDCTALVDQLRATGGLFTAKNFNDGKTPIALAYNGNCIFGIKPMWDKDIQEGMYAWYVGNSDAADVLETAIEKFTKTLNNDKDAKVGASGYMGCQKGESKMDVAWSVYSWEK